MASRRLNLLGKKVSHDRCKGDQNVRVQERLAHDVVSHLCWSHHRIGRLGFGVRRIPEALRDKYSYFNFKYVLSCRVQKTGLQSESIGKERALQNGTLVAKGFKWMLSVVFSHTAGTNSAKGKTLDWKYTGFRVSFKIFLTSIDRYSHPHCISVSLIPMPPLEVRSRKACWTFSSLLNTYKANGLSLLRSNS